MNARPWAAAPLAALLMLMGAASAMAAPQGKGDRMSKHAERGVACVDCHGKTAKKAVVSKKQCLNCHGDTKALAARTAQVKPTNPHENRHLGTEADCNRCHHEHGPSENLCLPCHKFNFQVP